MNLTRGRVADLSFAVAFLASAWVQTNDPDPMRWVAVYLFAATLALWPGERRPVRVVAGLLGFVAVFIFSLVGVHAQLNGIEAGGNAPAAVGAALGLTALFFMSVVMMTSAGSTLDSTFTSLAKSIAVDLPRLARRASEKMPSMRVGAVVMIAFAILGNLPMFAGTDILKATTISGTMVMGLAPVFLFYGFTRWSPWSFHLSFWTGIVLGVLLAVGLIPSSWNIGEGKYAALLGVNAWGILICTAGFFLPLIVQRLFGHRAVSREA